MDWIRRVSLLAGAIAAIGIILIDVQIAAEIGSPSYRAGDEDLRLLCVLVFGIAALYTVLVLLAPYLWTGFANAQDRGATRLAEKLVSLEKEVALARKAAEERPPDEDFVRLHRSVADLLARANPGAAKWHLERAAALQDRPEELSQVRYLLACGLASAGDLPAAAEQLERAMENPTQDIYGMLPADIEENGALYPLASEPRYDALVMRLLMSVPVGA